MATWNDFSEQEKNARWNKELHLFGVFNQKDNQTASPATIPMGVSLAYGKLAASLPDKESIDELTGWLQPWMASKGYVFEDGEKFRNELITKSYESILEYATDRSGKRDIDYSKQVAMRAKPGSSLWKLGEGVENPLDILRAAVIKSPGRYNKISVSFFRNGTREDFWNYIHAGALAHDIEKDFLKNKGDGVPEAQQLTDAVSQNVKAALDGIKDGSILGTEGTCWIKDGAYRALRELRELFVNTVRKENSPYNGNLELDIATNKVESILRKEGIAMDVEGAQPEKGEEYKVEPDRMLELKEAWLDTLRRHHYETKDMRSGKAYQETNDLEAQYLFQDSIVVAAYQDIVTGEQAFEMEDLKKEEIPAFTDMVQEWCRENGSLLANEGTGKIEFREKMLAETLRVVMQRVKEEGLSQIAYGATMDQMYRKGNDELAEYLQLFSAGGARYEEVFRKALAREDSEMLKKKDHPKEAWERLESREGMETSLYKDFAIMELSEQIKDICDNQEHGADAKQKEFAAAIKKATAKWFKECPKLKEMGERKPGTIKGYVNKAINVSSASPEDKQLLKDALDKAQQKKTPAKTQDARGR